MRIMLVAGARPNFMKIASVIDSIKLFNHANVPPIEYVLVHTGQHYDERMSASFFMDLELPIPDVNLEVGSLSHACQTAEIMKRVEPILLRERPDVMVVVGDVNSTLACTLVASKITYPNHGRGLSRPLIAHVEAGLRSFDRSMPEEINRIVTDTLSDFLFTSEEDAQRNLLREGVPKEKIFFVGNTMVDTLLKHRDRAKQSGVLERFGLTRAGSENYDVKPYAVVTLHRPSNVDHAETLQNILEALSIIDQQLPVFFPIHPRTMARVREFGFERYFGFSMNGNKSISLPGAASSRRVIALNPLGYLEFLCLMANAKVVLTDSGGIQEETTALGIPCITLRDNTERPVTVESGTNVIAGTDATSIISHFRVQLASSRTLPKPKHWDGGAGNRIVEVLAKNRLEEFQNFEARAVFG
jgi:UDP-N-acetylglucosamine 2-epimerase (non-hydrolysing)